ncbi:MAG: sigma-70 family RNA polymerase sigma factor [Planctomycetes bacterium]|nr:sigma-70 family RNA polymerase sigma factor [Planctomycetota bacterium]
MKSDIERELVEACRRQDRSAQRQLYELTSEKIYRLMLRMTRNADDAFDLTQDAYVRVFTQIEQFDGRSSLATWVYRIAVNLALQFLRRARTGREKLDIVRQTARASSNDQRHITRIDVRGALAALDADEQAILLLRYHEGHSYQEIAEVLECAEGTVASRLNRARQKLKDRLSASYGPSEENTAAGHPIEQETEVPTGRHGAGTEFDSLRW